MFDLGRWYKIEFDSADVIVEHPKYDYYNDIFQLMNVNNNGDVLLKDFVRVLRVIGLNDDLLGQVFSRMNTEYNGIIRSFQFNGYCTARGESSKKRELILLRETFVNALNSFDWTDILRNHNNTNRLNDNNSTYSTFFLFEILSLPYHVIAI